MGLTSHQSEVLSSALEILETSKRLLIKGSAGVGKTFMVDELLKVLSKTIPKYKSIYCSAPTNKAVSVLAGKITEKEDAKNLSLITIHSALKIGMVTDKNTGIKSFKPLISNNPKYMPLVGVALLIIDESSMIGEEMLGWIEEHATINKTTVIFLGDEAQINPVKEEESPVFLQGYPEVELTEIIRQGEGNPIITLSRNMSAMWDLQGRTVDNKGFVYTTDEDRIINELATINGSDELKYLAWENKEVDKINTLVREKIYTNPAKIELGESLIFDEPYQTYFTNQEIKVDKLDIVDMVFNVMMEESPMKVNVVTLKTYVINGKQVDEWNDGKLVWKGIFIIHEDAEKQLNAVLTLMKYSCLNKKLKWTSKNAFEDRFAKVKYNHAITVHKSQGSTYKQAILNVGNINRNPSQKEKTRLFYTGITRASDLLILYNV
ncbi:hypothetical protein BOX09_gp74 [Flavobacterium phage Fpv1]|uniref:UvrD-like helicase C-terminal domain-containing protein n=2 Tax=Fipvunavirus Fpv1 TaxID=2560475 RepID=A0A1B0WKJ2_9CAUD|nr:hypothetical protein BOW81_gp74 [Flavobacterium phage Fpv20]YP_009322076.1 hypothetical protein BOX09_gp74 [Flavobacterium phage Fpv1]YP_009323665.1 hypothetical protein BOW82_gp74 [Flavobacterium phage Fpv2]ALN97317.1 hypothetical protein [Flavobacterium phage FpV21]QCW20265.1 hypothetical protein [Flavobacterium phage FPSV-F12]ANB40316.1 hypothetical protein [Flavobacterium phage Fpv1]ANB40396.1 hypothetical protein [Flavobacterium phage Fpv2]ANB40903.1 hypothetical protein [Flavobacter